MTKSLRGINLGGWLVAERWMTPYLFEGVKNDGEIAIVRELGYEGAKARLEKHRSTFITEKDFTWIKEAGFDFVRLPVGYWLFEQTDDFIDGEGYLEKAFDWARRHRLGIVLDFHGLQGSQNGLDHSGQVGKVRLYRDGNRGRALRTLEYMCRTYGQREELIGVELINEPKIRWFLWRVLRYYDRAIAVAESHVRKEAKIIVSDGFKPLKMARALSKRGYGDHVVLDIHLYQVFDKKDQHITLDEHIAKVQGEWQNLLKNVSSYVPVMVGEWSAGLPPAAYADGHVAELEGSVQYFRAQQELFDAQSWGYSYWSYKAPGFGVWDYRSQTQFQ